LGKEKEARIEKGGRRTVLMNTTGFVMLNKCHLFENTNPN